MRLSAGFRTRALCPGEFRLCYDKAPQPGLSECNPLIKATQIIKNGVTDKPFATRRNQAENRSIMLKFAGVK